MADGEKNVAAERLHFASDYMEGAHPAVLDALVRTNLQSVMGYGDDPFCADARRRISQACGRPDAEVHFVSGGTQANQLVIDCMLQPWQGVVAVGSGHVSVHEAGAIEYTGHKVMLVPDTGEEAAAAGEQGATHTGKMSAAAVTACRAAWEADGNHEHMVEPALVYLSQPTEYGTLYSRAEIEAISEACHASGMRLYVDGARLAYALATPENDVTLQDLARLCDCFYVGGTKCGALCGEAIVFPTPGTCPHFFTRIRQHGALIAKGRLLGVQFQALFSDGLYQRIGQQAIEAAARIRQALAQAGFQMPIPAPTNQVFFLVDDAARAKLDQTVDYGYMEAWPDGRTLVRFATSWATTPEATDALVALIQSL